MLLVPRSRATGYFLCSQHFAGLNSFGRLRTNFFRRESPKGHGISGLSAECPTERQNFQISQIAFSPMSHLPSAGLHMRSTSRDSCRKPELADWGVWLAQVILLNMTRLNTFTAISQGCPAMEQAMEPLKGANVGHTAVFHQPSSKEITSLALDSGSQP